MKPLGLTLLQVFAHQGWIGDSRRLTLKAENPSGQNSPPTHSADFSLNLFADPN